MSENNAPEVEINNQAVRELPQSTIKSRIPDGGEPFFTETRVISVEPLAPELIKGVSINENAKNFVSQDQEYLVTEEFIRKAAGLTVPRAAETEKTKRVLVPATFGRGNTTLGGRIPYAGLIGGFVGTKGGLLSGFNYPTEQFPNAFFGQDWTSPENPGGVVYESAEEIDTKISNLMLGEGARTSLNLGHVILEEDELKKFILEKWEQYDSEVARKMIDSLEGARSVYAEDKSPLVIQIRAGGTPQRLELLNLIHETAQSTEPSGYEKFLIRGNIAVGARIMLEESATNPDKFLKYLNGLEIGAAQATIKKLSEYQPISEDDVQILEEMLVGMAEADYSIIKKLEDKEPAIRHILPTYFREKDVDFAFIHYDFDVAESSESGVPDLEEANTDEYWQRCADTVGEYVAFAQLLMAKEDLIPNLSLFDKRKNDIAARIAQSR